MFAAAQNAPTNLPPEAPPRIHHALCEEERRSMKYDPPETREGKQKL
jgi:hypothetical protein